MTISCGSTNHDIHLKYLKIDININQLYNYTIILYGSPVKAWGVCSEACKC